MTEDTTKTEKGFEPISTQAAFDERIKARLARERERWEKESDTEELKSQLEAKETELTRVRGEHAVEMALRDRGLTGPVGSPKAERIKKLVDFDSEAPPEEQLERLAKDVPELFAMPQGAGSRGSRTPVLTPKDEPLTREEVEKMSPEEVNSRWDSVKAFLAGERN
jgi:hypothetical protein